MPDLDLSDVLLDPMLAGESFSVIRRAETISGAGRSIVNTQTMAAIGSVTPVGDNTLRREADYQVKWKTIKVVTTFPLRGAETDPRTGQNCQPDIVVWHGDNFLVRSVDDFSNFGAGFVEAECTSMDLVDQAPQ